MSEVLAIGFHGRALPREAPTRSAPILTRDGHVVVEQEDGSFTASADPVPSGPLPGRATTVEPPLRFRPAWLFVVLGPADVALLRSLGVELTALPKGGASVAEVRSVRDCVAVYCEPRFAASLWAKLREGLQAQVQELAQVGSLELEATAWRLQRAALNDEDRITALATLHRCGAPLWRDAIGSLFPARVAEVEALVLRRSDLLPRPKYGALTRDRAAIREQFRARQAA